MSDRRVYLLMRHPAHPYRTATHLKAGEVLAVYSERAEPARIAAEKNARRPICLYVVHSKSIKGARHE